MSKQSDNHDPGMISIACDCFFAANKRCDDMREECVLTQNGHRIAWQMLFFEIQFCNYDQNDHLVLKETWLFELCTLTIEQSGPVIPKICYTPMVSCYSFLSPKNSKEEPETKSISMSVVPVNYLVTTNFFKFSIS